MASESGLWLISNAYTKVKTKGIYNMKIRFLLACLITSSLVVTPVAFSANLNAMKVTKYKTYNHNIWLYSLNGDVQQNVSGFK